MITSKSGFLLYIMSEDEEFSSLLHGLGEAVYYVPSKRGIVAKIRLNLGSSGARVDFYRGVSVKVFNSMGSAVDEEYFSFDDHLFERVDDHPGSEYGFAVADCEHKYSWYFAVPKTTKTLIATIKAYVAMWEEFLI